MHYLALIHHDRAGPGGAPGYGLTIPDLPGFTAYEESGLDDAIESARRVLADHVAALVDNDLEVPVARSAGELEKDEAVRADWAEAVAFVMLPVVYPGGRTMRVNISIDEATLELVDGAARARGITRSAFFAEASRRLVAGGGEGMRFSSERARRGRAQL